MPLWLKIPAEKFKSIVRKLPRHCFKKQSVLLSVCVYVCLYVYVVHIYLVMFICAHILGKERNLSLCGCVFAPASLTVCVSF